MRLTARSPRQTTLWVLLCVLFMSLSTTLAQDAAPPEPGVDQDATPQPVAEPAAEEDGAEEEKEDLGPMSIDIDIDRLLFDSRGNNVQDPVWRLQASAGKQILLIPFTVDNVNRVNTLSRFPLSVRAGRLVGFVIPKAEANTRGGDSPDLNRIIRAAPGELQQLLFDPAEDDAGRAEREPVNASEDDRQEPTPDSAPRLAREIVLHPDATVQWEMDRNIRGAELQSPSEQNPYAYKIDPQHLRDAQPERAERLSRNEGEDSRAYAERKRAHLVAEREKQNAYRELRADLRELPEAFREPATTVMYAAIEAPADDTLSLEGPSPFPWTVDPEKKQLFEQLSRGANVFQEQGGEQLAGRLVTMIEGHPLDARAIAHAAVRGRLASQVQVGGPGYQVLARLLQSSDLPTRRVALYSVATVNPPSLASARLIGVAGEAALGDERKMLSFASLGKLFSTQSDEPDTARVLIDRVSQTIADPQGPSAPKVIQQVLAALDPAQTRHRGQTSGEAAAVMIEALDLSGTNPEEFDGVARAIIKQAPQNPVAAGWLDRHLLGSANNELVNQTLALLDTSRIEPPTNDQAIDYGTPEPEPEPESESEAEPSPEPAVETDTLVLSGTIPIARADHALLALFDAADASQQAAAWDVLGRFHLALPESAEPGTPPVPETVGGVESATDPNVALFDAILNKAAERDAMPASAIAFIVNQQDPALTPVADERFVALLAQEDLAQAAAKAALDAYTATPERFTQALGELEPVDQFQVMQTMYRAQGEEAPLMAGLIADRGQARNWLTGYVKDNARLPTPDAWAELAQTQSESALLQSASSEDVTLATAGAAGLVVSVGGNKEQEQGFAQKVVFMASRELQLVKTEWDKQRARIFAAAFKDAAGTYQLVVTLLDRTDEPPEPTAEEQADEPAGKRIDLGVVELKVEGVELSLSAESVQVSSMSDKLGIRLENPASLRSFSKSGLTDIPPQHLSRPIDLLPDQQGVWSGQTALPDGKALRVSLEPAD